MEMDASVRKLIVVQPSGAKNETIFHAVIAVSFEAAAERIGGCALLGSPRLTRRIEHGQRLGHTQTVLLPDRTEAEMRWIESVPEASLPSAGAREIALYTLGYRHDGLGDSLKAYVFATSVEGATAGWRAEPLPYEGVSPLQGTVCAKLRFPRILFREPDAAELARAGTFIVGLVYDGPLGLAITRDNPDGLTMYLRRYDLLT